MVLPAGTDDFQRAHHMRDETHTPTTPACCKTCQLGAARAAGTAPLWDSIHRTRGWDVAHAYNSFLPGWTVLVARRHIEALDQLTAAEAAEMGPLIRRISMALKEITGCVKTYVIQFAEHADHPHVHFHIVPRMADQPDQFRSTGIFGYLGASEEERVSVEQMERIATRMQALLI
jgi:diadenosine tetraphosphate (Ap4A) HIT family hydrolase